MQPQGLRGADVAAVVKLYAEKAGLDAQEFSGHSLRAGFVTSAAESGASVLKMVEVFRHRSVDVLRVPICFASTRARRSSDGGYLSTLALQRCPMQQQPPVAVR